MSLSVKFGNYILLKKIAVGGMAELFLARQVGVMGFERIVAIKKILPHLTNDKEFVEMFINEAKLAAQLTHPNIVQIFDFGVVEGTYFIAMEFIMGKSLAEILIKGKKLKDFIPGGLAVYLISKIAAGLDFAFQGKTLGGKPLGIVHRDISPQNILIGYNGDVKLVDFGIAKAASSNHHTQTGVLKGKLAYFSPEQAWGEPVDHRSDIFSLGVVLYEMLTERRLFKAENEIATIEKIRKGEIPPPSSINTLLPKTIDAILLKTLARKPEERFQNAGEFEEALTQFFRLSGGLPTAKELSSYVANLYPFEIKMNNEEYEKLARVESKGPPERPFIPATETDLMPNKIMAPFEKGKSVQRERGARPLKYKGSSQEEKETVALFRVSLGVLGVIIALMVAGFILMKVRTDAILSPKGAPSSFQGEGSDSRGKMK
jgi:serine/threonine protein kinase